MTIGIHMCRGNLKGTWMAEGGYEPIAERLFNQTAVDAFFLEFDTPRAGDFAPLRHVPKNKTVVLGLISSKTPALENGDDIKRRINDAARYVDLDRLCLSPQCGFSSGGGSGQTVGFDDERRKLELVLDVVQDVWK
jgi:5-methyltetrahydropteroyltriglutamate--homocysteine methyltransferase